MGAAILGIWVRVGGIVVDGKGSPNAIPSFIHGKAERRWHDADYGVEVTAQTNAATDDRRIRTELRGPERMTDQGHPRASFFFIGREASSKFRTNPKRR